MCCGGGEALGFGQRRTGGGGQVGGGKVDGEVVVEGGFEVCRGGEYARKEGRGGAAYLGGSRARFWRGRSCWRTQVQVIRMVQRMM